MAPTRSIEPSPGPTMLFYAQKVYVLYVDHQGHPAPLSSCYHATGTRRISSSLERWPASTLTEIDSAFCPQCLTPYDADTAARLGFCPKASCQRCPRCQNPLTLDAEGKICFYKCGLCNWDSRGCQLTQPVNPQDDGCISRVELARALEDLGSQLTSRREAASSALESHSRALTTAWEKRTTQRQGNTAKTNVPSRHSFGSDGPEGWSVEALEASLDEKKRKFMLDSVPSILDMTVEHVALDADPVAADDSIGTISQLALELQSLNSIVGIENPRSSLNDLLPLPIPLVARLSRRCRAELEEGRPGILLKPKLNPLEGDTSLRTGHGQWWKKVRYI